MFGPLEEKIVGILAQGDTVAVQVSVKITTKEGQSRQEAFAAFLKFDAPPRSSAITASSDDTLGLHQIKLLQLLSPCCMSS